MRRNSLSWKRQLPAQARPRGQDSTSQTFRLIRDSVGHAARLQQAAQYQASPQAGSHEWASGRLPACHAQVDRTAEHKISECLTCHNPLGKLGREPRRIAEDICAVQPVVTEHITCEG